MKTKHLISWVVTLSIILAVGGFYAGWRSGCSLQAWYDAVRAHHTEVNNCLTLGEEVCNRVVMAVKNGMSMTDFENEFGQVTIIDSEDELADSAKEGTHLYMHEESYRTFYLSFRDNVLIGCNSGHNFDDVRTHLPSIEERIRQMM